jgi:serine/threonine protein kinase/tetratricopeptide (TPR) repeat protein
MVCPECSYDNPENSVQCAKCTTPLPLSDQTLATSGQGWSVPAAEGVISATALLQLSPGTSIGSRYEIVRLLGQGGMGAVYQAYDKELERQVAIKVIRADMAANPEILQRFKQELILARQITHKNVIRIFDLGQADGIKFITMEYIEGENLQSVLRQKKKLDPAEAANILAQVCRALEAAHNEGVIHRDLKPQNIMLDKNGRAYVMDFGIARSMLSAGMTQTGALIGTPDYMSPEQAKGQKLDARSDLFSLGIIFYEMLSGQVPFDADTTMGKLWKRTNEPARPLDELDKTIPRPLSDIVRKCLEIHPQKRFASATELLGQIEQWQGPAAGTRVLPARFTFSIRGLAQYRSWIAGGAVLLLLAISVIVYREKFGFRQVARPAVSVPAVSLAIVPFRNTSGDKALDWLGPSLADMLSTDVGQSSSLRVISPDRLHQVLHDLQISPDSMADPATVRRLADLSSADTVVWGQYAKFGDQIRVDATLRDVKKDRTVSFKTEASSEKDLLPAVDRLAQTIRGNLALPSSVVDELKAQSFKPSSKSMDAIRLYSEGTDLARQGKNLEALKQFQASTQADPDFALAYAKLGQTYAILGHDAEAEQASRKAVDLAGDLPAREKYLITANYARIERDYPKAIQYYENLATASPDDPEIQLELARLYEDTGVIDKARDHYSKVLSGDPKNVDALLASGRLELRSSNPQGALDYFNRALTLSIQLGNDEAKGTILQGIGVSYRQLDKQDEALRNFQQALEVRRRLGDKRGIARTLESMAQIQEQNGKSDEALKGYQEALQLRREIGDKGGLGDTLLDLGGFHMDRGHYDQALGLFKQALQVQRDLGNEGGQGVCLNNIGVTYLSKGDYENALTYFQQALESRQKSQVPEDIAFTLHNLAITYEDLGQYDQALSNFERAIDLYRKAGDKRGMAMQSYTIGRLFGYQGRLGAAINATQEALKTFTELQDRTYWMTEVTSSYGMALAEVGRFDDAQKPLDDALALARDLKIDGSIAQALDFQGLSLFYRGDLKGARALYDQALQFATRSKEQDKILLCRFHVAQVALKEGRLSEANAALTKIAAEADTSGMKNLGFEAAVSLGEALVESKSYDRARQQLERAIAGAEKLELRVTLARAHYSLATALRLSGRSSEAAIHYSQALQYLDQIRKDVGSDSVLQRSDLKPIYTESARWSQQKAS